MFSALTSRIARFRIFLEKRLVPVGLAFSGLPLRFFPRFHVDISFETAPSEMMIFGEMIFPWQIPLGDDFHLADGMDVAGDPSSDHDIPGLDVGPDDGVLTDRHPILDVYLTFQPSIDHDIVFGKNLSLDQKRLARQQRLILRRGDDRRNSLRLSFF